MAKQVINIGSASNDRAGDTLRSGAIKINSNFTELYNSNRAVFDRLNQGSNIILTKTGDSCTISATATPYTLPAANTARLGGVKVDGSSIMINGDGVISASVSNITGNAETVTNGVYTTGSYSNPSWITGLDYSKILNTPNVYYSLPTASTSELGGVKVDGSSIIINDGVISTIPVVNPNTVYTTGSYTNPSWINSLDYSKITGTPMLYVLPIASQSELGGVKVDNSTITIDSYGTISSASAYTLPIATNSKLGGVKVDNSSIMINADGVISVVSSGYSLPIATTTKLGGVKVDNSSITIDADGVITSHNVGVVALSRATKSGTTASIAAGETANLTISGYKSYALYSVATSSTAGGAWVRIYTDVAARTADASRSQSVDPSTPGVIAEVITASNSTVAIAPGVIGFNNESTPTTDIEIAVTNVNATAATFTITLVLLALEG